MFNALSVDNLLKHVLRDYQNNNNIILVYFNTSTVVIFCRFSFFCVERKCGALCPFGLFCLIYLNEFGCATTALRSIDDDIVIPG